jgi:hypothetical protein
LELWGINASELVYADEEFLQLEGDYEIRPKSCVREN